jgi:hypothetical protein
MDRNFQDFTLSCGSGTYTSEIRMAGSTTHRTNPVIAVRGCIQKFPDWPPGARTANGTTLCH